MMSGDARVNTFPPLGALHTLFHRYHNYIAAELAQVHPDYDDEILFQEARKIVIAVIQRITHREFLPFLLRRSKISDRLLYGNWTYKKRCDATLYNVMASAALRYGHSMIPDFLSVHCDKLGLASLFLRPGYVLNSLDSVVKHATTEHALTVDRWVSAGMMNHMRSSVQGPGRDMMALNIQRGRDHGLASYTHWRRLCHLPPLTNFSQLHDLARRFQKIYNDESDVELFPAALVEKRVGLVGATFTCLLTKHFEKLRFCDRFWWETKDPLIGFASDKLREEIDKTRLSHIICLTTNVYDVQRNVFRIPNPRRNKVKPCSRILKKAMNVRLF